MMSVKLTTLLLLNSILYAPVATPDPVVLASNGQAHAVIVVAADAPPPDRHAAQELRRFLNEAIGVEFRIVHEAQTGNGPRILVGPAAARMIDSDFNLDGLETDGIVMRLLGDNLVLAGQGSRGTLYAVYSFLEDVVGCRWWSPTSSHIPSLSRLEVADLDVRYAPPFSFREPYWGYFQEDGDWCVRNKNYGRIGQTDTPELGGRFADILPVHNFYELIPPAEHFDKHPEWFSEINGRRVGSGAQLCLTNVALRDEVFNQIKNIPLTHPGVSAIWIGQNDWDGACECAKCTEVYEREDSLSGTMIDFVNDLAERLEEVDPNVAIATFAYEWTQKPPKYLKPRHNVNIWLATTGCSYAHPYTHPINQTFHTRMKDWSRVCDRIYIWDYIANFAAYLSPYPNLRTFGPNLRTFADHHVVGVWSQGAYSAPGSELGELRAWVLLKLMWDPSLDADALIDEFLDGYYGNAGPHIRAYLDVFHDAMEASEQTLYMTDHPLLGKHLTLETLIKGYEHMNRARLAVEHNRELSERVQIAQLPILYVMLLNWDNLKDQANRAGVDWPFPSHIKPVYNRFVAVCEEANIKQKSERNARDLWPWIVERVTFGDSPAPPECHVLPRNQWCQLQDRGFNLKPPHAETGLRDRLASDGSAARMDGDHSISAIQKQLWRIPLVAYAKANKRKLRVMVSIRCEMSKELSEAVVFKCDFQNTAGTFGVKEVRANELKPNRYTTLDLGTYADLHSWASLRITPVSNPDVKSIWVDRIWLILED